MSSWTLYWITRLDYFVALAFGTMSFLFMLALIVVILYLGKQDAYSLYSWDLEGLNKKEAVRIKKERKLKKQKHFEFTKKIVIILIILGFMSGVITVFIPTTKEFAFIYLGPKVINNEQVQKIPANVVNILNKKMEEYLNENLK